MADRPTPRISYVEIKAGVFLTLCLALFIAMLFVLGKFGRAWRSKQEIHVVFTQVNSVRPGAPVLYNGMEAGHVKKVNIVYATPELLSKLPPFAKRDLASLPLSEEERARLAELPPAELDAQARRTIHERTLILLVMDVLSEHDDRRFRVDDEYRIVGSMMGDSAVEIRTGCGVPVPSGTNQMFLGVSGDIYTDLDKSLGQVKDILATLTELIGTEGGRGAVQGQLGSFDTLTQRLENTATTLLSDLPKTWDGADQRIGDYGTQVNEMGASADKIKPKLEEGLENACKGITETRESVLKSVDAAREKVASYRSEALSRLTAWKKDSGEYRETLTSTLHDAREGTERMVPKVERMDAFFTRADDQLDKGIDSTRAMLKSYTLDAARAEDITYTLKTAPWMLTSKPEPDAETQQNADHAQALARRHYLELYAELQRVKQALTASNPTDHARLARIEQIVHDLDAYLRDGKGEGSSSGGKGNRR